MRSKLVKFLAITLSLLSFFMFNKFVFFPTTYQQFYESELELNRNIFTDYKSDRISDIYHKIYYLCRNNKKELINRKILLAKSNLYGFMGEHGEAGSQQWNNIEEEKSRDFSWVIFPLFSTVEFFEILFNNGLTSIEIITFLKYKFGIPFNIKDEINLLWDLYINKKVFISTLLKRDNGTQFSLSLNKGKYNDINKKYITLLADIADHERVEIELSLPGGTPDWLNSFSESLAESSEFFKVVQKTQPENGL